MRAAATGTAPAWERAIRRKERLREIWRYRYLYALISFGVLFFIVFAYTPMYGIQLAFKHYSIVKGITGSPWVGFDNFTVLFQRAEFWNAVTNTLIISAMRLFITFPIPIILAIVLNELVSNRLRKGLQVIYTLPHFLSWVTISGIMINLLASDGVVNGLITALGGQPISFLTDGHVFRGLLVFSGIWKEVGWSSIIYLAAIAGIDPSLYESATIDGANRVQRMWYITWYGIRGTAAILLILAAGNVINGNFDQVFNMYNPTVMAAGDVIDTYLYRISFQQAPDYGVSTAVGLFKGIINCILLLSVNFFIGTLDKNSRIV